MEGALAPNHDVLRGWLECRGGEYLEKEMFFLLASLALCEKHRLSPLCRDQLEEVAQGYAPVLSAPWAL